MRVTLVYYIQAIKAKLIKQRIISRQGKSTRNRKYAKQAYALVKEVLRDIKA